MLIVYPCGTEVALWDGPKAKIEAVMIENGRVAYRVSYWADANLVTIWVEEGNVSGPATARQPIGIKPTILRE